MNSLQAASIRAIYPDDEMYFIRVGDDEFVVRTITPLEYGTIKGMAFNRYDEEDLVAQTGLVYPSEYNVIHGDAGIANALSKVILSRSLLLPESKTEMVDRFNHYNYMVKNDIDTHLPVIIKTAFPEFTFEEIESWNIDKQLKNLARALFCLKLKGVKDIEGYEILDDTEELTLEDKIARIEENNNNPEETFIDPVTTLYDEYKTKPNIVDFPFILGLHWDNEDVIYGIQRQKRKRN